MLEYYNTANSPGLNTNIINKIFIDKAGNYWIGTENSGLYLFDKTKKTFSKVRLGETDQGRNHCCSRY
ncbi:two-component regulator propeller domain-containing protein [uncultured Draconibacterium sp.]|uniref:two-component regulator propeller domain-containing protein n=1 Tax=uncultured Draconibacterium sp. TaxID=1573823 RepID=UPI003749ABCB